MKKLSVLVALMLIITVGGVYATWTYINATVSVASETVDVSVKLAGMNFIDEAIGEITVDPNSTITLTIDDNGDHEGVLVGTGSIRGTFEPHDNAAADVKDGIPLYFQLEGTNLPSQLRVIPDSYKVFSNGDDVLEWEITADEIIAMLQLDLELPTATKYTDFKNSLNNPKLTITISQYDAKEFPDSGV